MNFNESEKCLVPSEKKSVVTKKTEENSCDKDPEQSRQLPNASQGNKKSMNIIITAVTIVIVVLVVLIILLRLFIRRRKGLVEKSCHEENENPQNLYVEIHETNKKIKYGANAGKSEVQYAELMLRDSQNKEPELVQDKIIYSKIAGVILPRDRKSEK
ncbi:uncharacterized protein LOC131843969 isoform X2 [Achroia grisella]|uniref:uncharacterized protein LOC131843969 isoform X2 n=1 Tax=Achroia grisella TaxID=688607 RepID=UPI0027D2841B|nr:uncharacterized protein LOC131843969 isoform X2 [Achroia grisella]